MAVDAAFHQELVADLDRVRKQDGAQTHVIPVFVASEDTVELQLAGGDIQPEQVMTAVRGNSPHESGSFLFVFDDSHRSKDRVRCVRDLQSLTDLREVVKPRRFVKSLGDTAGGRLWEKRSPLLQSEGFAGSDGGGGIVLKRVGLGTVDARDLERFCVTEAIQIDELQIAETIRPEVFDHGCQAGVGGFVVQRHLEEFLIATRDDVRADQVKFQRVFAIQRERSRQRALQQIGSIWILSRESFDPDGGHPVFHAEMQLDATAAAIAR